MLRPALTADKNMKNNVGNGKICGTYPKFHTCIHDNWNQAYKDGYSSVINLEAIVFENYL